MSDETGDESADLQQTEISLTRFGEEQGQNQLLTASAAAPERRLLRRPIVSMRYRAGKTRANLYLRRQPWKLEERPKPLTKLRPARLVSGRSCWCVSASQGTHKTPHLTQARFRPN